MLISSLFSTPLVDAFWTAQPGCARNSTGFFWGLGGFARRIHLRVSSPKLASFEASVRAIPTAWDLAGCFCLAAHTGQRPRASNKSALPSGTLRKLRRGKGTTAVCLPMAAAPDCRDVPSTAGLEAGRSDGSWQELLHGGLRCQQGWDVLGLGPKSTMHGD